MLPIIWKHMAFFSSSCNWVKNDCRKHYVEQSFKSTRVSVHLWLTRCPPTHLSAPVQNQTAREANWLTWTFCMITCSTAVLLTVRNPPARFNLDAYHTIVPPARYFTPAQFLTNSCWGCLQLHPHNMCKLGASPDKLQKLSWYFTCLLEKLYKKHPTAAVNNNYLSC